MIFTYRRTLGTTLRNFAHKENEFYIHTLRTRPSNFAYLEKNDFYIPTYNFEAILNTLKTLKLQTKIGYKINP